ncbi:MAG TPA: fatty acid desaturase, partial [Thermohalobaculum sp.]|nr:fatty acid desaturase [Thermohalobaculum sp.]
LVLNHEGMSKAHEHAGLPMLERVVKTTRNLGQSRWHDLLFGGVNNHIEHHLFPEIPVVRLGKARRITRDFCLSRGYGYVETGFLAALASAAGHFAALPRARLEREALS